MLDRIHAVYACLNINEAVYPIQIKPQSVCLNGDAYEILTRLK